jgi:hypothetical protein
VHARLLPRLSRSWTLLLPSDTHRNSITSITAVLLPFVTYLLTLRLIGLISWSRPARRHTKTLMHCVLRAVPLRTRGSSVQCAAPAKLGAYGEWIAVCRSEREKSHMHCNLRICRP